MKHVIHLFGPSGSGTSTLGRAICERTGFALLESDDYLWMPTNPPFTTKRSSEERRRLLTKDLDKAGSAVIAGSMVGWGDAVRPRVTLAVRLYAPTEVRLNRIKQRELDRFGERILPGGDMYELQQAFYEWAAAYDTGDENIRSIAQHDRWQQGLTCPRLDLDGTLPIETLTETVLNAMQKQEEIPMEANNEWHLELLDTEWPFTYTDHDRPIVRAIVFDDAGMFYFVRVLRDDYFGKATLIETSGGGVEQGEELLAAIRRELKEELGAEVEIVQKIGVVSDYYNLIHRRNINHYYLCRARSFGEKHLMPDEIENFHLSTLRFTFEQAVAEYKACAVTPLGRLIQNRELPVLLRAKELLDNQTRR